MTASTCLLTFQFIQLSVHENIHLEHQTKATQQARRIFIQWTYPSTVIPASCWRRHNYWYWIFTNTLQQDKITIL